MFPETGSVGMGTVVVCGALRHATRPCRGYARYVGFNMGILRVGFSHTVPVPPNTVPAGGYTRLIPQIRAVSNKTR